MSHPANPYQWPPKPQTVPGGRFSAKQFVTMMILGPRRLLTSRISGKCAALMVFLCTPSLLFSAALTIPALLFQSPNQQAYYYFGQLIQRDPTNWLIMPFVAACALGALIMPAATADLRIVGEV
jgi:hypothetical protein